MAQWSVNSAWRAIGAVMKVKMLCHTYIDYCSAKSLFPNADIFYSSFAEDYIEAYDEVDIVAGTRIHGMGLGASLGIPGVFVSLVNDTRGQAARGFNSIFAEPEDILEVIMCMNIRDLSEELIERKKSAFVRYVELVRSKYGKEKV